MYSVEMDEHFCRYLVLDCQLWCSKYDGWMIKLILMQVEGFGGENGTKLAAIGMELPTFSSRRFSISVCVLPIFFEFEAGYGTRGAFVLFKFPGANIISLIVGRD